MGIGRESDEYDSGHKHRPLPLTAMLHQNSNIPPYPGTSSALTTRHPDCLLTLPTLPKVISKSRGSFALLMADQAVLEKMSELKVDAANKVK